MQEEPDIMPEDPPGTPKKDDHQGRRITLSANDQTVEIEGPDDLETMAKTAAYFWLLVSPPHRVRIGFTAGSSLVTERSEPYRETDETTEPERCP